MARDLGLCLHSIAFWAYANAPDDRLAWQATALHRRLVSCSYHASPGHLVDSLYRHAQLLIEKRSFELAIPLLEEAISVLDQYTITNHSFYLCKAHSYLAIALYDVGEMDKARASITHFVHSLRQYHGLWQLHLNMRNLQSRGIWPKEFDHLHQCWNGDLYERPPPLTVNFDPSLLQQASDTSSLSPLGVKGEIASSGYEIVSETEETTSRGRPRAADEGSWLPLPPPPMLELEPTPTYPEALLQQPPDQPLSEPLKGTGEIIIIGYESERARKETMSQGHLKAQDRSRRPLPLPPTTIITKSGPVHPKAPLQQSSDRFPPRASKGPREVMTSSHKLKRTWKEEMSHAQPRPSARPSWQVPPVPPLKTLELGLTDSYPQALPQQPLDQPLPWPLEGTGEIATSDHKSERARTPTVSQGQSEARVRRALPVPPSPRPTTLMLTAGSLPPEALSDSEKVPLQLGYRISIEDIQPSIHLDTAAEGGVDERSERSLVESTDPMRLKEMERELEDMTIHRGHTAQDSRRLRKRS